MLLGTATVTRAALPAPAPLRFKDDVLLRDRITTAEKSAVRVLLGGKATVTARERSVLVITEVPGTSTVFLTAGRTAVAVSKAGMKPGESLEIKTPNAVAAVRGTFVVAEVWPRGSTITILRGVVEVTKLDPGTGKPVGPAVKVGALERVIVTGAGPVPAPQPITPEAAKSLASDFTFLPKDTPAASVAALNQEVKKASMSAATDAVNSIAPPAIGTVTGGASTTASVAGAAVTSTVTTAAGTATTTTTSGVSAPGSLGTSALPSGGTTTPGIGATAAGSTIPTSGSLPISPTVTPSGSVLSPLIPTVTQTVTNSLLPGRQLRP
jgi:hypothetical protein